MIRIEMGNAAPLGVFVGEPGQRTTTVYADPVKDSTEIIADIDDPVGGLWNYHSSAPPLWVQASDPDVEAALQAHFAVGPKPADWVETTGTEPTPEANGSGTE